MRMQKNKFLLSLTIVGLLVYCLLEAKGEGDFYIFMWAAGELSKGLNIYDHKFHNDYSYYYSVLFALCLKPFFTLSFYWVKFVWLLINISMFCHLVYLLLTSSVYLSLVPTQKKWFLPVVLVFSLRFVHENIHHAQITILMLWSCVYGLYSIYQGNSLRGSLVLAIGINIKLFPLVFIPYLLYRAFYKEVLMVCMFYAAAMFLPSLIIGHDFNLQMLHSWWALVNPSNSNHVLDVDERSFHGLSTLLATLLVKHVPDTYAMSLPRNIADVPYAMFSNILLVTRLLIIGTALFFLRWPPFRPSRSQQNTLLEIAYILLVIPLIFPHQQHYAFLFATPAFACLWYFYVDGTKQLTTGAKHRYLTVLVVIFLLCTLKLWLGEFNAYYEHFKILTYGALLCIPTLMFVAKKLPGMTPETL